MKYIKIWWKLTMYTANIALQSRFGAVMFILGKFLRFLFFFFFLILLGSKTKTIANYSLWQMILFFATFNLIDTLAQFSFREVYRFRTYVVNGLLDYILCKPISPLFRSLFGGSDILDVPLLFMSLVFLSVAALNIGNLTLQGLFFYVLLIFNAFIIALAFHIFVLSLAILTTEIDSTLFLYRDLTQMGRIPIDIYKEPLRGIITFFIPVGIMMTFPSYALLGLLSWQGFFISLGIGIVFFYASIQFWQYALRKYSSASS